MQALWRTLRNPVDNIAHVAFRVLGKFGGGNRKMLREPQMVSTYRRLVYSKDAGPLEKLNSGDRIAHAAFRVQGKLGGGNRKVLFKRITNGEY